MLHMVFETKIGEAVFGQVIRIMVLQPKPLSALLPKGTQVARNIVHSKRLTGNAGKSSYIGQNQRCITTSQQYNSRISKRMAGHFS